MKNEFSVSIMFSIKNIILGNLNDSIWIYMPSPESIIYADIYSKINDRIVTNIQERVTVSTIESLKK